MVQPYRHILTERFRARGSKLVLMFPCLYEPEGALELGSESIAAHTDAPETSRVVLPWFSDFEKGSRVEVTSKVADRIEVDHIKS